MTDKRPKKEKGGSGPNETPKAKQPSRQRKAPSAKAKASAPRSTSRLPRGAAVSKYDWDLIRNSYVSGTDTIQELWEGLQGKLSNEEIPSFVTIRDRASAENWVELRRLFTERVLSRMQQTELAAAVEVRQRQARGAIRFQEVALEALEIQFGLSASTEALAKAAGVSVEELSFERSKRLIELPPFAIARLWSMGAAEERKARGLDELDVNLNDIQTPEDLRKLSLEQLLALKAMRRKALGTDPSAASQSTGMGGEGEAASGDTPEPAAEGQAEDAGADNA